eukprot:jgi/Undpi1/8251/HiC_scaffold_25.g10721.m1
MVSARNLTGTLVVLLLSARLEAFSVCPFSKSSASNCRRAASVPSSNVLGACSRGAAPVLSAWTGSRGKVSSCGALRMNAETTAEVTTGDLANREFQLEELEDRDVAETSIVLNEDGTITAGATNGPLPMSVRGKWAFDGKKYSMEISREFDASIPYVVSRVYAGYVEEVLPATDTMIVTGDIVMDDMDVGFFKMISAPSDILDSLEHVDGAAARRGA